MLRTASESGRYVNGHRHQLKWVSRMIYLSFLLLVSTFLKANSETQFVSLFFKEASLEKVMAEIKKQTGYSFAYFEQDLLRAKRVSVNMTNARIVEALDLIFEGQPLSYLIVEKVIVVKLKKSSNGNGEKNEKLISDKSIDVVGKVSNEEEEPLVGVTVQVKGTSFMTVTNEDGVFKLNKIDPNAVLLLTAVNILPVEKLVNGQKIIEVRVQGKTGKLDEVQVVAYGKTSQRYNVGNVSTVKSDVIARQVITNPVLALQGRVPGLVVTQENGIPGGAVTVRIQGTTSINAGQSPLYVIDGVPYSSILPPAGSDGMLGNSSDGGKYIPSANGNPLSYINPADIESIDVLKDADATAIYGSRAANGAILITTKKGKMGKAKVSLNVQQGWGEVTRNIELLNRRQYLDMRYEAYKNDGISLSSLATNSRSNDLKLWDTTRSTNWQKMLIGNTAKYANVNANISGGSTAIQYLLGITYNKSTTVFPGNFSDQRAAVHFNVNNVSENQRLKLKFSGNYMFDDNKLPGLDLTAFANTLEPVAPSLYNVDGNLNWAPNAAGNSTWNNPLVSILYQKFNNKVNNLISNITIGYTLAKGFELSSMIGYTNTVLSHFYGTPLFSYRPELRATSSRSAIYGDSKNSSWIVEPQLTYNTKINKGEVSVLIGSSIQQNKAMARTINGSGYASDEVLEDFKAALSLTAGPSTLAKYKYCALFGRLNYKWDEKYILNLNVRRDGTSRFGVNNRFHNFYSVGAGWIFANEKFMKALDFISFGKIRGSYGITGNDQIGDYNFLSLYAYNNGDIPYQNSSSLRLGAISNPYLAWEETKKMQVGMDVGLLKDRILLNITYSRNRSSNQLLSYILPSITGRTELLQNFPATMQNTSWEFSVNSVNVKNRNVSWTSSVNLTIPRNKVVSFPGIDKSSYASGNSGLIVGKSYPVSKYFVFSKVDPLTGQYLFIDASGDEVSAPNYQKDRSVLQSFSPIYYGGFQNRISFKGLELDFLLQFVKQIGKNNFYNNGTIVGPGSFLSGNSNQPLTVLNRWQKSGDITTVRKFSADRDASELALTYVNTSTMGISDASFVRLKNMSLSWMVPKNLISKISIESCRIFLQGQNLLTITKFKGQDPENISPFVLPPLRVLTVGLQMGF